MENSLESHKPVETLRRMRFVGRAKSAFQRVRHPLIVSATGAGPSEAILCGLVC